jgi:alginate export protein
MMYYARFIFLLAVMPLVLLAQNIVSTEETPLPPPSYKVLRFDEDYSCLTNPANHSDWFDPVKYIPLSTNHPSVYLSLGGELRERFEAMHNPDFGIPGSHDAYWLQRITLLTDLHLSERVRIFAEGISGLDEGNTLPTPPVQKDPIDLQFAFIDVVPYLTHDERVTLRTGRFGMSFGSGRLVATRAAPNIPFKFDGFEALYTRPLWEATAFLTQPVKDSGGFDGEDHTTTFWGLYTTHWFGSTPKTGIDLYYLGIHREHGKYASGTGEEYRHSMGAREFGQWNHWDWNAEEVLQVGSFDRDSILAWTASIDTGYTWDATLKPRVGLKADVTSGDHNAKDGQQQTFDALYFKSGYFNDASLLRPQNIVDVHPNAGFELTRTLSADGGVDFFWRYSRNDAVYAVPGFIAIPARQSSSSYVGTALDLNLEWRIQRHLIWQASYVYFFTGNYVRQAGGGDVNYVSTTISFLF